MKAFICFLVFCVGLAVSAVTDSRTIYAKDLARIRCSLNTEDETFFVFNGTVQAYFTTDPSVTRPNLFKTIGINVGRCWKTAEGVYTLASRELLYYLDPITGNIINQWTNPWNASLGSLNVAHVDNDPVLQVFNDSDVRTSPNTLQVYGDTAFLNLDIAAQYPNPLRNSANGGAFASYSPQANYQFGEYFKFIFPISDLDSDKVTVDTALVSWTREGPWLPWMAMGSTPGHLIYSSSGAKIPSWEYLPPAVKADLQNRIPHYKHAPLCVPATASVTSWTFFKAKFAQWQAGDQFPLSTPAVYGCVNGTQIAEPNYTNPTPSPSSSPTSAPTSPPLCVGSASKAAAGFSVILLVIALLF